MILFNDDDILTELICEASAVRKEGVVPLYEFFLFGHIAGTYKYMAKKGFANRESLVKTLCYYYNLHFTEAISWVGVYEEVFDVYFDPGNDSYLKANQIYDLEDYLKQVSSNYTKLFPDISFNNYP